MHRIRRLLAGIFAGLAAAGLMGAAANVFLAASRLGFEAIGLGSALEIVIVGALLGGSYALLFRPARGGYAENLMSGLALGAVAWIILALNVQPILMGSLPMWRVDVAATALPRLVAYLWQGALVGLLYGLAHDLLAERLALAGPKIDATPPAITRRVVILGGGYAGVSAAQALERELAGDPSVGVWLVSQTNYFVHTPLLSEVSSGAVNPQNISPPLRSFFRRVQVVQGELERIDLDQRQVHLASNARSRPMHLPFDHLVLAVGSVPHFFGNAAIANKALTFKSLEDAVRLRGHIISLFERADLEAEAEERRRMLTFVVAGGGFAGVELVGAINDFARGILPFYPNILPEELRLLLAHSRGVILPELSATLGEYARQKLEQRGVEFRLNARVSGARPDAVLLGDEVIPTETLVWTAGNRPSPVLATLGLPLTEQGRIAVNAELAVLGAPGLWAAGDCAQIPDLNTGGLAPPTAQHALREGKVLGHNVVASIRGQPLKAFDFKALGSMAALGHQLAVAEVFGRRFSGFLAWVMWRAIYLSKLPTLEKQIRVGLDWLLDIFFPADIVQTMDFGEPAAGGKTQGGVARAEQAEV